MEKTNISEMLSKEVLILLRKIIQSVDLQSRNLMKQVGLTGPQLVVLAEISRMKEPSIGELSKAVSLSQATVTGILERLEKRGLITRRRSRSDKRRIFIHVTSEGNYLLENSPPLMHEYFIERFNRLEEWEKTLLLSSLQRLATMMDVKENKSVKMTESNVTIEDTSEKIFL